MQVRKMSRLAVYLYLFIFRNLVSVILLVEMHVVLFANVKRFDLFMFLAATMQTGTYSQ
jgi:hypothetical protein